MTTKEERITKIVNVLKTTPKGKLSYDRDPSSPPILAPSPLKNENEELEATRASVAEWLENNVLSK